MTAMRDDQDIYRPAMFAYPMPDGSTVDIPALTREANYIDVGVYVIVFRDTMPDKVRVECDADYITNTRNLPIPTGRIFYVGWKYIVCRLDRGDPAVSYDVPEESMDALRNQATRFEPPFRLYKDNQ